jgi:hypothetical protein
LAAAAAVVVAGGGCDWRTFDTLAGQTPVLNVTAPSDYPVPSDFGSRLIALEPPTDGSAAARYLVSATNEAAVAVVNLDAAGHPSGTTISAAAFADLNGFPITGLAEIPGTGRALLGSPNGTGGTLRFLDLSPPYSVTSFVSSTMEPLLGIGVAAGALGGGPAPDLVAVSFDALHVYLDGQTGSDLAYTDSGPGDPCPITLSGSLPDRIRDNRPVVIAPLLGGRVQIAVGTPVTSGAGTVSIFDVDATTGKATCALALHGTTGADQLFGQALAVGDFDADGVPDLLVGEPPATVYLYRGPITAAPTATITDPGGIAFGAALAALPLDGHPGDEALLGDPDAMVAGTTLSGRVTIRTGASLATMVKPTPAVSELTPRDVHDGDHYGAALAALTFCASASAEGGTHPDGGASPDGGAGADAGAAACARTKLPLVGALSNVYTYFTLAGTVDPRAR